jgi:hypothetical protein
MYDFVMLVLGMIAFFALIAAIATTGAGVVLVAVGIIIFCIRAARNDL